MENRNRLHLLLKQLTRKVTGLRGIILTCADEYTPQPLTQVEKFYGLNVLRR
jgi:hypothetical protein